MTKKITLSILIAVFACNLVFAQDAPKAKTTAKTESKKDAGKKKSKKQTKKETTKKKSDNEVNGGTAPKPTGK